MEHKSTKRSINDVPNVMPDFEAEETGEIFDFPKIEMPRIEPFKPMTFDMSGMNDLVKEMNQRAAEMQREAERFSRDAVKTVDAWNKKFTEDFNKKREDMTYTEYVDSRGYKVVEGKSKDGKYTIIHKQKIVGSKIESEMEIIESGQVFYKSSSLTNSYSYRNGNGEFVTVEERRRNNSSERVYTTPHAKVVRRKKKTTNVWGKILLCVVIAVILYIVFFR